MSFGENTKGLSQKFYPERNRQAEIVAERIADEVGGRTPTAEFCGTGYCMLEADEGLAGFAFGDFFAEPSTQTRITKSWQGVAHWQSSL